MFINWGGETPEQKAARYRMEMDALYEQAARIRANSTNSSSAGGNDVSVYCGGEKIRDTLNFPSVDFQTNPKFAPTTRELDNFSAEQEDLETDFRVSRDEYLKQLIINLNAQMVGKISQIAELPELAPSTVFYKRDLTQVQVSRWSTVDNANNDPEEIEPWNVITISGKSAAEVMPNVKYFNFLNEIQNIASLPMSGNPGDVVWCIDEDKFFAWDSEANSFTSEFYDLYVEPTYSYQRSDRDSAAKAKNELILAIRPFLFANKYIIDYRIKKSL